VQSILGSTGPSWDSASAHLGFSREAGFEALGLVLGHASEVREDFARIQQCCMLSRARDGYLSVCVCVVCFVCF
jgi:hypothetical protein